MYICLLKCIHTYVKQDPQYDNYNLLYLFSLFNITQYKDAVAIYYRFFVIYTIQGVAEYVGILSSRYKISTNDRNSFFCNCCSKNYCPSIYPENGSALISTKLYIYQICNSIATLCTQQKRP